MNNDSKPDPMLEALAKPGAPRILPKLDEHQVPWCDRACPYLDGKHCTLLGTRPENVCIPGVRILIDMANAFACHQHEH